MSTATRAALAQTDLINELEQALEAESRHYRGLVEIAEVQGRLMTGSDLEAIRNNAKQLADGLSVADQLRQKREGFAGRLMRKEHAGDQRLSTWITSQSPEIGAKLQGPVVRVREACGELMRINEKNRRLASFCLDLVEEEAGVLRRGLLEDPAGRYDRGAKPAQDGGGRMLTKKA